MRNHFTMIRSGQPALRVSLLTLLTVLPSWVNAASFEKAYTESMIVPDSISMAEAKHTLIDQIRLDALNDAGARLKNTKTLVQVGTRESDPTSVFSKTMVSLIHVGQPNYEFNKNADGQIELIATAGVSVDDAELQKADDAEREAARQKQRIVQLERENAEMRDKLLALPKQDAQPMLPEQAHSAPTTETQTPMPYVDEIVNTDSPLPSDKLTNAERNNNDLNPAQQVRFDQLCERFKAVDEMILKDGVQTAYLGTTDVSKFPFAKDSSAIIIHSTQRVTWDWTAGMEIIRHLMGNVGTINGDVYTVNGADVNDKAVLVAVRKCEHANRFPILTEYIEGPDISTTHVGVAPESVYRLVFKGDHTIQVRTDTGIDRGVLLGQGKTINPARVADILRNFHGDKNRLFGTENLDDPIRFGNEELKTEQASARQAQAAQPKPVPQHSRFVSFFGRVFAAGITGHTIDPAKCAEYRGVLVERPGPNGTPYFSCDTRAEASRGNVIAVIPPLPAPTQ